MLKTMWRIPFLGFALAHQRAEGYIIVDPVYIGICMMNDIVLEFPDKGITAQYIRASRHEVVYPAAA